MWPEVTSPNARPGIPQEKWKAKVSWEQQFMEQQGREIGTAGLHPMVWNRMQGREIGTAGASHHGLEQLQLELGAGADGTSRHSAGAWHRGWLVPR